MLVGASKYPRLFFVAAAAIFTVAAAKSRGSFSVGRVRGCAG